MLYRLEFNAIELLDCRSRGGLAISVKFIHQLSLSNHICNQISILLLSK